VRKSLLIRLAALALFVPAFYLYDNYIAKPRINIHVPAAALAAGWSRFTDPAHRFSIDVPPDFVILDPSRADYQKAIAEVKKKDPVGASHMENAAKKAPPPDGFIAVNPYGMMSDDPKMAICKFYLLHAGSLISESQGSINELQQAVSADNPGYVFGPLQRIKTPCTEAYLWTGTNTDKLTGMQQRLSEIVFLDKYDAYVVNLFEMPGTANQSELANPIAQTFREYSQHTGWEGTDHS